MSTDRIYRLLLRHPETKVVYYEISISNLNAGSSVDEGSLPMDPSGIVYNSVTREPIEGAIATLIGPDGDQVPENQLGIGQQNQTTGSDGFYRFDLDFTKVVAGDYLIIIEPPQGYIYIIWPLIWLQEISIA